MKNQYKVNGYNITTDAQFQNKRYGVTPELEKMFERLYVAIQDKNNKRIIGELTQLIVQYPTVPILKNYLSVAYNVQGKKEKAIEVNQWILVEHPGYLFGLINRANYFIDKKEFNKVPQIIGEAMEIKALYPDRDLFHLSEITSFYKLTIRYYAAIENLELAENRFEILYEIAPDHHDTEEAESFLFQLRMKSAAARIEEERKQKISTIAMKLTPKLQTRVAPTFNHPEIQDLYHFGIAISHEKLKGILALPRVSLVEDLEKILEDAVERYDYFDALGWQEETHSFVLHALFLLKELNAAESLPKIISLLKYDDELVEFWLGDHITVTLWQCFYGLGFNNTAILKDFLLQPGVNTYCKSAISEAFCQMVLHHSEKRDELLTVFSEVFTVFSRASLEDNLIDSDFLGLAINEVLDCNLYELLPVIKALYEKGYVSIGLVGDYDKVEKEFARPSKRNKKYAIDNIFELYNNVLSTWSGYREEEPIPNFNTPQPIAAAADKIGRNEPCPCGSGKKYKKCCMQNSI